MILDGLLIGAAAMAWTTVLWFYGRAEYREPRWIHLLATTAVCFACFWIPWVGWLAAAVVQHMALRREHCGHVPRDLRAHLAALVKPIEQQHRTTRHHHLPQHAVHWQLV